VTKFTVGAMTYGVRAVLCDLDGTLIDSAEDLRAALNAVLRGRNLPPVGAEAVRGMIGDGVPKLIERGLVAVGGDPHQAPSLLPEFLRLYEADPAADSRCYPGVVETLGELCARHCRLAVVTNKPVVATRKILQLLGLADFFDVIVGGDTLPQRKPDPAPLREAARQLALDVTDLVMVGDNVHDIEAARAAGMTSIAVTYGYHHRPPSTFGADRLIDRFDELLPLIRVLPSPAGAPVCHPHVSHKAHSASESIK